MALKTAASSAAVVFVAYLVRGVAGFGSGLIAMPLLTLISPITAVVPVVVSLDYIGSASQSVRNLDDRLARAGRALPFMLIGILGTLSVHVVPTSLDALGPVSVAAGARFAYHGHVLRLPRRAARHVVRHRRPLLRDLPARARSNGPRSGPPSR